MVVPITVSEREDGFGVLRKVLVGKLITFAGCNLIAQVVNGPARCIE